MVSNHNFILGCVACLITGYLGATLVSFGATRRQAATIASIESRATEQQRAAEATITELTERCSSLENNQRRTAEIIESVGRQLATDSGNLTEATEIYQALSDSIRYLYSYYNTTDVDGD